MPTKPPTFIIILLALLFIAACSSQPTPPTAAGSPDGIQTATGAARSDSTDKELKIQTAASQEGAVTQSSADVRNQEETQSTTSGHVQTLGFAGIGNVADVMQGDPILLSIQRELERLLDAEEIDTARVDSLREQMASRAEDLSSAMRAATPSFDALKTIVAIFTMENATGHEKTPLTDAAAASKADAFQSALTAIGSALEAKEGQ